MKKSLIEVAFLSYQSICFSNRLIVGFSDIILCFVYQLGQIIWAQVQEINFFSLIKAGNVALSTPLIAIAIIVFPSSSLFSNS